MRPKIFFLALVMLACAPESAPPATRRVETLEQRVCVGAATAECPAPAPLGEPCDAGLWAPCTRGATPNGCACRCEDNGDCVDLLTGIAAHHYQGSVPAGADAVCTAGICILTGLEVEP